ncbi:MAG: porphobilinogen synthase [Candidatus Omnitrophica bacterium]|nr:porphobilinogen synthase [Candidatus Omnitrophota bacterium]
MAYPVTRLRRLRQSQLIRDMVREADLNARMLIYPLFVVEGQDVKEPVAAMPGIFRQSIDTLLKEAKEIVGLSIPAVLLFGFPERRDERASVAFAKNGVIQTAVRALKDKFPDLLVITDVCLCAYSISGHCGILKNKVAAAADETGNGQGKEAPEGEPEIFNDQTLEVLAKIALSHAEAGADMLAPSSMMDGQVAAIRRMLDGNNFKQTALMSAGAKFNSQLHTLFHDPDAPSPHPVDRMSYLLSPANAQEALRDLAEDVEEGADIVMVSPAMAYLDIIARAKQRFPVPIAAFQGGGEFGMVKAATAAGWMEEKALVLELLTALRRGGADLIVTFYAKDVARWLSGQFLL